MTKGVISTMVYPIAAWLLFSIDILYRIYVTGHFAGSINAIPPFTKVGHQSLVQTTYLNDKGDKGVESKILLV